MSSELNQAVKEVIGRGHIRTWHIEYTPDGPDMGWVIKFRVAGTRRRQIKTITHDEADRLINLMDMTDA